MASHEHIVPPQPLQPSDTGRGADSHSPIVPQSGTGFNLPEPLPVSSSTARLLEPDLTYDQNSCLLPNTIDSEVGSLPGPENSQHGGFRSQTNQTPEQDLGLDSTHEPICPRPIDDLDNPLDPDYGGDPYDRLDLIANLKLDHLCRDGKWPESEATQTALVAEIFEETAQKLGLAWPKQCGE